MEAAVRLVSGPEERREAGELEKAFGAFHAAVARLKVLGVEVDDELARLDAAREGLRAHGVEVDAKFETSIQAAYSRRRSTPRLPRIIEEA